MGQTKNGVEVLLRSPDSSDLLILPATITDVIEQDAFVYWDTSANKAKKFAPADSTDNALIQNKIIGIASAGKKNGDTEVVVLTKGKLLMDATNPVLGADVIITYNATTGKYSVREEANYNAANTAATNPDITLASSFLLFATESAEADNRVTLNMDGRARFAALT